MSNNASRISDIIVCIKPVANDDNNDTLEKNDTNKQVPNEFTHTRPWHTMWDANGSQADANQIVKHSYYI